MKGPQSFQCVPPYMLQASYHASLSLSLSLSVCLFVCLSLHPPRCVYMCMSVCVCVHMCMCECTPACVHACACGGAGASPRVCVCACILVGVSCPLLVLIPPLPEDLGDAMPWCHVTSLRPHLLAGSNLSCICSRPAPEHAALSAN
jgi:hypothetical protein